MEFPFVQFEFTHAIGPTEGRYVAVPPRQAPPPIDELDLLDPEPEPAPSRASAARAGAQDGAPGAGLTLTEYVSGAQRTRASADVIVISLVGAPAAKRRTLLVRRGPAVQGGEPPAEVSLQLATVIRATRALRDARTAAGWLAELRADREREEEFIDEALAMLARSVRAYRIGAGDPYVADVTRADARAIRIGYGDGREVADGRWNAAYLVLAAPERVGRADRIRPSEIVAGVLNHRAPIFDADELLLRAVLDLDQRRGRAAAFQLRAALELLPRELERRGVAESVRDRLERLDGHSGRVAELCRRSLDAELRDGELEELVDAAEEAGTLLNVVRSLALSEA